MGVHRGAVSTAVFVHVGKGVRVGVRVWVCAWESVHKCVCARGCVHRCVCVCVCVCGYLHHRVFARGCGEWVCVCVQCWCAPARGGGRVTEPCSPVARQLRWCGSECEKPWGACESECANG